MVDFTDKTKFEEVNEMDFFGTDSDLGNLVTFNTLMDQNEDYVCSTTGFDEDGQLTGGDESLRLTEEQWEQAKEASRKIWGRLIFVDHETGGETISFDDFWN